MLTTITGKTDVPDVSRVIHHLPCSIGHTGEAAVSAFFLPTIRRDNLAETENVDGSAGKCDDVTSGHYTAAFRGRPLNGTRINLAPSYTGLVLEDATSKTKPSLVRETETAKEEWNVVGKFDSVTYWNWDKLPSEGDGLCQLMQWTRLAGALETSARDHMPVDDVYADSDVET